MNLINLCRTILLFVSLFQSQTLQGSHICYPWRAAPAIVQSGTSLRILYQNTRALDIDSVVLKGPYSNISLLPVSVVFGHFVYDTYSGTAANNQIVVEIPSHSVVDLYDLLVYCGGETHLSPKSVKIVSQFEQSHRFLHISDPHVSRQWVGTQERGYAKELELLDRFVSVANILAPDFVIVTGDLIHDYTRLDADELGWGGNVLRSKEQSPTVEEKYRNYYEGAAGFRGIHGIEAPVFSTTGNHDFYGVASNDHQAKVSQWNAICGKRVHGFSYAGTRVLILDDYLGDPVIDIPDHAPLSGLQGEVLADFLQQEGTGQLRILAKHRPDRIDTAFCNQHSIGLLLNGHNHRPFQEYIANTPTLSMRPGSISRSGSISEWEEVLGFFRIVEVNGASFTASDALRFCADPTVPAEEMALNLTLDFDLSNDGSAYSNKARIINHFPVDLPKCKIRFVMQKGVYCVSSGRIEQMIETEKSSIIDVRVDVCSKSTQEVEIRFVRNHDQ